MDSITKLNEDVDKLTIEVTQLKDAFHKSRSGWRHWIYLVITVLFMLMLVAVPVLAIIGNVGGAVVLGVLFLAWFTLNVFAKIILFASIAYMDAQFETITHKRDSFNRLGINKL